MRKINNGKAYDIIQSNPNVVILDLRSSRDYSKGHIPNAININPYEIKNKIEQIAYDRNAPIIVYCYSGSVSIGACLLIEQLGYKNVFDLQSLSGWVYKWNKLIHWLIKRNQYID